MRPTTDPWEGRFTAPVRIAALALVGAVVGCMAAGVAHATTLVPMDLRTLSTRADAVVVARCIDVRSEVDPATHIVVTTTRFAVDQAVKGAGASREVVVRLPGGAAEGRATVLADVPSFSAGATAVLFLSAARSDGSRGILGLSQGSFAVSGGSNGQVVHATAPEHGGSGESVDGVPLADFLTTVRAYLR